MLLIKKLIAVAWIRSFLASSISLFLIVATANIISGLLRSWISASEVFFNFFIEAPTFIGKILPVSCLMASLFSLTRLKNTSELTAIFASGITKFQVSSVIIILGLSVSTIQFINLGFISPALKKSKNILIKDSESKFKNLKKKGLITTTNNDGKLWFKSQKYFFSFRFYDQLRLKLYDIDIYYLNEDNLITKIVKSSALSYSRERKQWESKRYKVMSNLHDKSFPTIEVFTDSVIPITQTPDDFDEIRSDITTLNIFRLRNYINKLKEANINTNEYEVMYLDVFISSLMCIIFALLSSIVIFNPNKRTQTTERNVIFVLAFVLIYWLFYSYAFETAKFGKISPYLSLFSIPLFFIIVICVNFYRFRNLRK